jgi:hypothetical protein
MRPVVADDDIDKADDVSESTEIELRHREQQPDCADDVSESSEIEQRQREQQPDCGQLAEDRESEAEGAAVCAVADRDDERGGDDDEERIRGRREGQEGGKGGEEEEEGIHTPGRMDNKWLENALNVGVI